MRIRMFSLWAAVPLFVLASTSLAAFGQQQNNAEQLLASEYINAWNLAQSTGKAPEGMGFLRADSNELPAGVRASAFSTFRIAVPAGDRIVVPGYFGLKSLKQLIGKVESAPLSDAFGIGDKEIMLFQVRECLRQKKSSCEIFDGVSFGTAFLTGDGSELRTALHVIEDFARFARKTKASSDIPIVLLDGSGNMAFGPSQLNARVVATFAGALDANVYGAGGDAGRFDLDQVLIKLRSPIGSPIRLATKSPEAGETLFIAGFPKRTEDRAMFKAQDSDGVSLAVSRGTVLSESDYVARLRRIGQDSTVQLVSRVMSEGLVPLESAKHWRVARYHAVEGRAAYQNPVSAQ